MHPVSPSRTHINNCINAALRMRTLNGGPTRVQVVKGIAPRKHRQHRSGRSRDRMETGCQPREGEGAAHGRATLPGALGSQLPSQSVLTNRHRLNYAPQIHVVS